jgi:hypothetical protein
MDHIGIDVHKRESQICVFAEGGELIEQPIRSHHFPLGQRRLQSVGNALLDPNRYPETRSLRTHPAPDSARIAGSEHAPPAPAC